MRFTGVLIVALLITACGEETTAPDETEVWIPIGSNLPAPVTSLCASDSGLIAATAEGLDQSPTEARLWRWSDGSWGEMTPPLIGEVRTMKWYQGALVVGGFFTAEGDPSVRSLAQWDGTSWVPVGSPLGGAAPYRDPFINTLIIWRDQLLVGGYFSFDGPGGVAIWDGHVLESLQCHLWVTDLAVWRDTLIAGGDIPSDVPCVPGSRLEAWTGNEWIDFAGGVQLQEDDCPPEVFVSDLLATSEGVFVAGGLPQTSDLAIQNLALWTGQEWIPMRLETSISNILEANGYLFAAEWKIHESNYVWRWHGSDWSRLGATFDGAIYDLVVLEGNLVAAGAFTGRVATVPLADVETESLTAR